MNKSMRLYVMAAAFVLIGCTTVQYDAVYNACNAESMQQYPPKLIEQKVKKYRTIKVPTGKSDCVSRNVVVGGTVGQPIYETRTSCTQETQDERQYYTDFETVDLNYDSRRHYVNHCVPNQCVRLYGNRMCEQ
jgi:hypothetical protein